MNENQIVRNIFTDGVIADLAAQKVPNKSMTYSLNGRVIFNRSGSLSWVNARGNRQVIQLGFNYGQANNYTIIGGIEISNYLVLLSTQNTVVNTFPGVPLNPLNSEIGVLTEDSEGNFVYQTVFNDLYDPNKQLLHLNTRYQAKVQANFENKNIIRIYWCDDYNENRVFNVVAGLNPIQFSATGINYPPNLNPSLITYFNQPYLPYTTLPTPGNPGVQAAVPLAVYPYWYSVHGMSSMCDVQFGLIKYQKNIAGSKLSGSRQYFYRLVHASGYATPWSIGTGQVFCTVPATNSVPSTGNTFYPVGGNDWTQYNMTNSGIVTNKGHQLQIEYIDTRFTYIEVAWAYYESDTIPVSAGIFYQGLINLDTNLPNNSMIIQDTTENVLTPIEPSTLIQRYTDITHAKSILINENYLHQGNVYLRPNLQIDTSEITIEPFIRLMSSDNLAVPVQAADPTNLPSQPIPITGQNPVNDSVNVQLFEQGNGTPYNETYQIGDTVAPGTAGEAQDYINYKGTQWDFLFKGEFRGQTVPLAIMVLNRKGQPFYAQHIGDFTMPEQFDTTWTNQTVDANGNLITTQGANNGGVPAGSVDGYTLTTFQPGSNLQITNNLKLSNTIGMAIKILGKMISGIDLTNVLFDQYGQLQISGFSIVRADRIPNLVAQGLIMNCSTYFYEGTGSGIPMLGFGNFISPLHSTGNAYFDFATNYAGLRSGVPADYPGGTVHYSNDWTDHGRIGFYNSAAGYTTDGVAGNYFTLELPDNLINPALITNILQGDTWAQNPGCSVEIVGCVQSQYNTLVTDKDCVPSPPPVEQGVQPPYLGQSLPIPIPDVDNGLSSTAFFTKNYLTDISNISLIRSNQAAPPNSVLMSYFSITNQLGDWGSKIPVNKLWTPAPSDFNTTGGVTLTQGNDIDNYQFTNISFLASFFPEHIGVGCGGIFWHGIGQNTQVLMYSNQYFSAGLAVGAQGQIEGKFTNPICYYLVNLISNNSDVLNANVLAGREYYNIGHFVPINETILNAVKTTVGGQTKYIFNNVEVWGGDCYVDFFGYARLTNLYDSPVGGPNFKGFDYGCGLIFPVETKYNHTMRIGNQFCGVGFRPGYDENSDLTTPSGAIAAPVYYSGLYYNATDTTDARLEDFNLNQVMQATDEITSFFSQGVYTTSEPDQPLLELYSNVKFPGETYDQFRLFLPNNQQYADSQYGWICDLEAIGHNIYVFQEKGFGRIRFNEFTQQVQPDGSSLTVGTGQGYQGHIYLGGSEYGCQHEWTIINDKRNIWWVNAYHGKHNILSGGQLECLSDVYGQHQYFEFWAEQYWTISDLPDYPLSDGNENIWDNPVGIGGISSVYDYRNKAEIVTFTKQAQFVSPDEIIYTGTPSTMEFNELQKTYQGNWNYYHGIYFSFKKEFYSYDPANPANFYEFGTGNRGEFLGVVYPSEMKFIVRAERQMVFDTNEFECNPQAFGVIEQVTATTVNGSQNVVLNNPAVDNRPVYRNSALLYPCMAIGQSTRVRGSYMELDYIIDNTSNVEVLLTEHRCFVRKDYR